MFAICPVAIALGTWCLVDYSNRPCPSGHVANEISFGHGNSGGAIANNQLDRSHPTLILFYHPHCPCTTATVRNLERLSCRFTTQSNILAYAYCPIGEPDSWIDSSLTRILKRIPNSHVIVDWEGEVCNQFGVRTSGHALVYRPDGKLLFSGGITPRRGHEGDCVSSDSLLDSLNGLSRTAHRHPVYGCLIIESEVR